MTVFGDRVIKEVIKMKRSPNPMDWCPYKKRRSGTSVVVQWLRRHLPMQGVQVDLWSGS